MLSLVVLIAEEDAALMIADFKCNKAARRMHSLLSLTAFVFSLAGESSVFSVLTLFRSMLEVFFLDVGFYSFLCWRCISTRCRIL